MGIETVVRLVALLLERVMNCSRVFPGVFCEEEARNRLSEVPRLRKPLVFRDYSS